MRGPAPINRTDPTGLHEIDVHYYITYFLGVMAGLPQQEALTIALADQYVDDNPFTWPVDGDDKVDNILNPIAMTRLKLYHFTQSGFDPVRRRGESPAAYVSRATEGA